MSSAHKQAEELSAPGDESDILIHRRETLGSSYWSKNVMREDDMRRMRSTSGPQQILHNEATVGSTFKKRLRCERQRNSVTKSRRERQILK